MKIAEYMIHVVVQEACLFRVQSLLRLIMEKRSDICIWSGGQCRYMENGKNEYGNQGIDANLGSYQADTFTNDWHKTLKADFILANPPLTIIHGIRKDL